MRRARIAYFIKYEKLFVRRYLFFKGGAVRSAVTDPFPLPDAISSCLSFPFYLSHTIVTFIFSPICHSVHPALYFFPLPHPEPARRFLRHRPRSDEHLHNLLCIGFE